MIKFFLPAIFFFLLGLAILYAYLNYGDKFYEVIFDQPVTYKVFLGTIGVEVTVADTPEERKQGLSGTAGLGELSGKLFIFDQADRHGIWMKDMNYPIDIFWIDDNLEVIHIEEAVLPESYPEIFAPDGDARFVLETKAFLADTNQIEVGTRVILPPGLLPEDIRHKQEADYSDK